jgi:hypothetical protein
MVFTNPRVSAQMEPMDLQQVLKHINEALDRIATAGEITETTAAAISAPLYRAKALLDGLEEFRVPCQD